MSGFCFKQKTAYEVRSSDWSSDVCSSDLDPNHYSSGTNILTKGNFTKWEDLKGAPVCGIQGAFYNRKTSEEFGAEIVAFKGTAEALTALKQNRCVAFVYDDAFILSPLSEARGKDWKRTKERRVGKGG